MGSVRRLLAGLPDKEVVPPILLEATSDKSKTTWISYALKYAAAVALLVVFAALIGKVLSVEVNIGNSSLTISFGDNQNDERSPTEDKLTPELTQFIEKAIADRYEQMNERALAADFDKSFREYAEVMDKKVSVMEKKHQHAINTYLKTMQQENIELVQAYLQHASLEQKQNMEVLVTNLVGAIQEVREQDLTYMQTRLNTIESDKERFKLETERILATLLINSANY